jgi:hypothetical protein
MWRVWNQFARGQLDIVGAAEGREARADPFVEIGLRRPFLLPEGFFEDIADLGLHRVPMLGDADAEALFESRIEIADLSRRVVRSHVSFEIED